MSEVYACDICEKIHIKRDLKSYRDYMGSPILICLSCEEGTEECANCKKVVNTRSMTPYKHLSEDGSTKLLCGECRSKLMPTEMERICQRHKEKTDFLERSRYRLSVHEQAWAGEGILLIDSNTSPETIEEFNRWSTFMNSDYQLKMDLERIERKKIHG